jgi:hypothetical protein
MRLKTDERSIDEIFDRETFQVYERPGDSAYRNLVASSDAVSPFIIYRDVIAGKAGLGAKGFSTSTESKKSRF